MTIFFLILAAVFGWLAWNLYRPAYNRGLLSTVSFLCGWLVGELAIHHIIVQVAIVALFIWAGAVTGLAGAAGFLVCLAAWFAMAWFYLGSDKAANAVRVSLGEGLGEDYESHIHPEFALRFPDGPNYERIRRPWGNVDPQVEVIKDHPFGVNGLTLDIYRSREPSSNRPVLLQIHGGAWTEKLGSKDRQAIPLMNHMALRDWICVATSYRLSPGATFPEHLVDCKAALAWIKENIEDFGGNPDFVAVTGGSAGGHLCALMALTPNHPAFQPGFEDQDTHVRAAVPFYGVYDFTNEQNMASLADRQSFLEKNIMKKSMSEHREDFRLASPLIQVNADAPPFLIIHGDKDTLVPVEEARYFAEHLGGVSTSPVLYAEIPGGQHAFDMFPSVRSEHVKHGVERFLTWVYSRYLDESRESN